MSQALTDSQLLASLVGFNSVSHLSNVPIANFVADYLDDSRIQIERNFSNDQSKVNLIIHCGPDTNSSARSGLVLSGHLDVVPATEPEWQSDPFKLRENEDGYIGRGACDMKGFVALAINTFRDAAARKLQHPLVLILTFDEEPGMLGAEHLVKTWKKSFELPRACIVGEPTSLRVVRMHRGHLKMRATFRGRTAHSGYPHLGINAIEPAARAMVALAELNNKLKTERHESSKFFPETPYVALNLGQVRGGEAINVVPDTCTIDFGVRLLPDISPETMAARCRETVESASAGSNFVFETLGYSPSLIVDESAPILRELCRATEQKDMFGVSYATDGGMLQRLDMDCAVWGPGTIEVAHKANESMPKADFIKARRVLTQLVQNFCG